MADQDIFNKEENNNTPDKEKKDITDSSTPQAQPPGYDNMLGMIVNAEGDQKYGSVEEALKGSIHAQAHIAKLEQELTQFKADQDKATKMDDVIAAVQSQGSPNPEEPASVNPTDIQDIVRNTISDMNTKAAQDANITTVVGRFQELYGEKASETLYGKANDLGMSREDINSLIAKNPNAALVVLGIDNKASPSVSLDSSSVNSESFSEKEPAKAVSSMGYVSSKELTSNWLATKERVLKELGAN